MNPFALTPRARDDLLEIWDYIARDSPDAADRVIGEMRRAMQRLAEMPGMGHVREDLADEALRVWPIYSYLIVYRPETRPLQILRVVSGYRDLPAFDLF